MTKTNTPVAITVEATVNAPIEKVWKFWSEPQHIKNWCNASPDWFVPDAENDLRVGGKFKTVMSARDKSMAFDFAGVYSVVDKHKKINYEMSDGRAVKIIFSEEKDGVKIVETFDAESMNPIDMQRAGWQAILDNFKKYTEEN